MRTIETVDITMGDDLEKIENLRLFETLLHFSKYGTVDFDDVERLRKWGFVRPKSIPIIPFEGSLILFELTKKGQKCVEKFQPVWEEICQVLPTPRDTKICDSYLEEAASLKFWAMSPDRLEIERQAGNINKVLERCPNSIIKL